jgi:hypothetical protein
MSRTDGSMVHGAWSCRLGAGTRRGQLRAVQFEEQVSVSELQLAENEETVRSYSLPNRHAGRNLRSLYRVSQRERSIFWEAIVSVILNKKVYIYMCPVPNGFRVRAISQ